MATNEVEAARPRRGRPPKKEAPPSDAVARVRVALELTQEQFAGELHCSIGTVRYLEQNQKLPSNHALKVNFVRLAKRAGVEVTA